MRVRNVSQEVRKASDAPVSTTLKRKGKVLVIMETEYKLKKLRGSKRLLDEQISDLDVKQQHIEKKVTWTLCTYTYQRLLHTRTHMRMHYYINVYIHFVPMLYAVAQIADLETKRNEQRQAREKLRTRRKSMEDNYRASVTLLLDKKEVEANIEKARRESAQTISGLAAIHEAHRAVVLAAQEVNKTDQHLKTLREKGKNRVLEDQVERLRNQKQEHEEQVDKYVFLNRQLCYAPVP